MAGLWKDLWNIIWYGNAEGVRETHDDAHATGSSQDTGGGDYGSGNEPGNMLISDQGQPLEVTLNEALDGDAELGDFGIGEADSGDDSSE